MNQEIRSIEAKIAALLVELKAYEVLMKFIEFLMKRRLVHE